MKTGQPGRLVLLRHGESERNARNLFTGGANPGLTAHGEWQAAGAGEFLETFGQLPDLVYTSLQRRAIRSAELALAACDRDWIPVRRSWRLNGRHYGALPGRTKATVLAEYGEEQDRYPQAGRGDPRVGTAPGRAVMLPGASRPARPASWMLSTRSQAIQEGGEQTAACRVPFRVGLPGLCQHRSEDDDIARGHILADRPAREATG
jgi:broad specificity phosphatase PhoE